MRNIVGGEAVFEKLLCRVKEEYCQNPLLSKKGFKPLETLPPKKGGTTEWANAKKLNYMTNSCNKPWILEAKISGFGSRQECEKKAGILTSRNVTEKKNRYETKF